MKEYCHHCKTVMPSIIVSIVGDVNYVCQKRGDVVDSDYEEEPLCPKTTGTLKRRRKRTTIRELEIVDRFPYSTTTLRNFLDDALWHIHQLQEQVAAMAKDKP